MEIDVVDATMRLGAIRLSQLHVSRNVSSPGQRQQYGKMGDGLHNSSAEDGLNETFYTTSCGPSMVKPNRPSWAWIGRRSNSQDEGEKSPREVRVVE